ncbi:MAG: hypothetical protein ACOX6U_01085 [Oscillospiraceae bacterium]|jgi:hypothetical protein
MKRFYRLLTGLFCLLLLTSCTLPEQNAHKLCQTYLDNICWMRYVSLGSSYFSKDTMQDLLQKAQENSSRKLAYCVVTAVRAEPVSAEGEGALVTFVVDEVLWGNCYSAGDTAVVMTLNRAGMDENFLQGSRYLVLLGDNAYSGYHSMYGPWSFYLTEDNLLVSPFGCTAEEQEATAASQNAASGEIQWDWSIEARYYTGKTLEEFCADLFPD